MSEQDWIVGGGMTGLAAGITSGLPVLEAAGAPGGICSSYYVRPGDSEPLPGEASDADRDAAYRFEIGGGHWIFGGDPVILRYIEGLVDVSRYQRKSSVYFPDSGEYVPYPLQNHLRFLGAELSAQALDEMARPVGVSRTMEAWLNACFGETLTKRFFGPFHDLYTAGLHDRIAPQDGYKSPVNLGLAVKGALTDVPAVGYNTTFLYPSNGLDELSRRMAADCDVQYGRRVAAIDTQARRLRFDDGSTEDYRSVLSTLPLNVAMDMAELEVAAPADPHTSVLVLNIGATKGPRCPDDHWLYIPFSDSGFHRVGFYSNVDESFLPKPGAQGVTPAQRVSIYIERAYVDGTRPTPAEVEAYQHAVTSELKRWEYIIEDEVVHPTWIDVAYTWSWPDSRWPQQAMAALEPHGVYQIGRYGRWIFQGIADSIRDGFIAGSSWAGSRRDAK